MTHQSRIAAALVFALLGTATTNLVHAQQLPRSYTASPDIYKVLAQTQEYKVLAVVWAPRQKDVLHSHPTNAVYYLTDCNLRIYDQDGVWRDAHPKAGGAIVQGAILGHVLENIGNEDCRLIMFEPN